MCRPRYGAIGITCIDYPLVNASSSGSAGHLKFTGCSKVVTKIACIASLISPDVSSWWNWCDIYFG